MAKLDKPSPSAPLPVGEGGKVHIVGIGDDGRTGLAPAARERIAAATLLCGGERHLAFFPDHPAERFVVRANLDALAQRLARAGCG